MRWVTPLLYAVVLMLTQLVSTTWATLITVCPEGAAGGCDTTSVSAAIRSASTGDSIYVSDGVYTETIQCYVDNDSGVEGLIIYGESESGTIVRWDVDDETYAFSFLAGGYPAAGSEETLLMHDMTWRLVQDGTNYFRIGQYTYLQMYNMTMQDSSANGPASWIYLESGDVDIDDCTFIGLGGTEEFEYVPLTAKSVQFRVDDCAFTDVKLHFEDGTNNGAQKIRIRGTTFTDSWIYAEACEDSLRVYNCDFTTTDDAASKQCISIAADPQMDVAALYFEDLTFTAPAALIGGSYYSYGILRQSDDNVLPDTIINCRTYNIDQAFSFFDTDSADAGETGGAGSYFAYDSAFSAYRYGFYTSYIDTDFKHCYVSSTTGNTCHAFMLGSNDLHNIGVNKGLRIQVDNCYATGATYGVVDKGTSNIVSNSEFYLCTYGSYLKGCTTPYHVQNLYNTCTYGVGYVFASTALTTPVTSATVKNNLMSACTAGLHFVNTEAENVSVQRDYNAYISCTAVWADSAGTAGTLTTLRALAADSIGVGEQSEIPHSAHSTDSDNWQLKWGGDSTIVITPVYNWITMGITQETDFPEYPTDFLRIEFMDSLVTTVGQNWKYNDFVYVYEPDVETWKYLYGRYIAGSDTLFLSWRKHEGDDYKRSPSTLYVP